MSELKEEKLCYGCLFCTTGKERLVAQGIEVMCPGVRTLIARQEKHKTVHGRKFRETVPLLPGYVFFPGGIQHGTLCQISKGACASSIDHR